MGWNFFTSAGAEKHVAASVSNPMARLRLSSGAANQNITNTTYTKLTYDTIDYDTSGIASTATSRMTIGSTGRYLVQATTRWDSSATGTRWVVIYKNGSNVIERNAQATSTQYNIGELNEIMALTAGDYLEVYVWQDSGGTRTITPTSPADVVEFSITKIDSAIVSFVGVPGSLVGQELAYGETTSSATVTVSSSATAVTVVTSPSFTVDGNTPVWIEAYVPYWSNPSAGYMMADLWIDTTDLGYTAIVHQAAIGVTVTPKRRITPTAGSHTVSLRAWVNTGSGSYQSGPGGVGDYVPGYIRVTRAA